MPAVGSMSLKHPDYYSVIPQNGEEEKDFEKAIETKTKLSVNMEEVITELDIIINNFMLQKEQEEEIKELEKEIEEVEEEIVEKKFF